MAISPVRAISTRPNGRTMRSNASTFSHVPVTSTITERRVTSMILPRKISTTCMTSPRLAPSAEILNSASSRATVSAGSRSRILITLTSLWSCLVTWSIGCIAPSRVSVMRESDSSSVGPTASVSMLNPRRANSPEILVRTPGLFSTRMDRMCLRPVRTPAGASSSSRVSGSLVPGSPISGPSCDSGRPRALAGAAWQGRRSAGIPPGFQGSRTPPGGDQRAIRGRRGLQEGALAHHLAGGGAGRDHRVGVLLAGDAHVDDHGTLGRERRLDVGEQCGLVRQAHARGPVGLGELDEVGPLAQVDLRVAAVPEQLLPLADHAQVAVVEDEHLHRDAVLGAGGQLLRVHLDRAVARHDDRRDVGARDGGAHAGG